MKFELLEKNQVKFTFEVNPADFQHALEAAYEQVKDKVEIKGFRKGNVPYKQYVNKYGVESLYEDALNHTIGHLFDQAIAEPSLTIVSEPRDIDVDVTKISATEPFALSFIVDLKPEVTLGEYKGIKVSKSVVEVTDTEVNATIDQLLNESSTLVVKESGSLEADDTAIFDFEGFVDGVAFEGGKAENHSLKIGSGQFIPGFEDGMIGLSVGEQRDVLVNFPESYHAADLAGKPATFKVTLHEIKTTAKTELTDDWVKTLNKEGIETVAQLQAETKTDLEKTKQEQAKTQKTNEVVTKVVEAAKVEIPKSMIDREVKNFVAQVTNQAKQYNLELEMFLQLSGMNQEQFDEQSVIQATRQVTNSLVIEAIAKAEKLVATTEELNVRYEELAKHYGMPTDEIKKYVNDEMVAGDITYAKAIDLIVDAAIEE